MPINLDVEERQHASQDPTFGSYHQLYCFQRTRAGSRKDRHERIGHGHLGLEAIARLINHPALRHLPFLLETPNELPGFAAEITLLRDLYRA